MISSQGILNRLCHFKATYRPYGTEKMTDQDKYSGNNDKNLLTRIRDTYTVGDTSEPESEEMNNLIVRQFIRTLAEVSLSVASRKVKETNQ